MRRTSVNTGWEVREKINRFAEMYGYTPDWKPVTLPHDAMISAQRSEDESPATGYFPGGVWEYRRVLSADERGGSETVALEFEGVYRDAVVTVNGSVAAQRPNGYAGFIVPLDHLLKDHGDDEIIVEAIAHRDSRWYSGAGIYRNVWLLSGGPLVVAPDSLRVATPEVDAEIAVVIVSATLRNRTFRTKRSLVEIKLCDETGSVVASVRVPQTMMPNEDVEVRHRLFIDRPSLWSPDSPTLYTATIRLIEDDSILDEDSSAFGVRSLSLDPRRGLRINGVETKLRGACVHHDNGPLGAATIDRAEHRRVELLKAAGFNALRSAHQPMSRAMLDACDRLGMLVMDETFDMWKLSKSADDYARRFDDWFERDLESMVDKDFNHPSVIFYSIGNEVPDTALPAGLAAGRALAKHLRALDPTRYVTEAVSGMLIAGREIIEEIRTSMSEQATLEESGVNTQITSLGDLMASAMSSPVVGEAIAEPLAPVDAAGYNYMESRFAFDAEHAPQRIVIDTEAHPPEIDRNWAAVKRLPNVIGEFTWTGWDYLGEVGMGRVVYGDEGNPLGMAAFMGDFPWLTAWCGDLDITGHRRPLSYFREIVFGLRREPYIAVVRPQHHGRSIVHQSPWAWSDSTSSWTWSGHEGASVEVEVYSDADEVELVLNGASLGRQATGEDHRFRTSFEVTYQPGVLEAVAWRDGVASERSVLETAGNPSKLELRASSAAVIANTFDLCYVEIELIDVEGRIAPGSDRPVSVEIEGPGFLQGLASGRPETLESFEGPMTTTFGGRCLAVVRPTDAGTITVSASAEGLEPAGLSIIAS